MFFEKKTKMSNFFTRCKYEQNSARSPPCSDLAAPNSHKTVTQIMASRSPGVQESKSILYNSWNYQAHRIKAKTFLISMSSLSKICWDHMFPHFGHPTKQRSSWKWMQPFTIPSWSRQRPLPNWSSLVACPCEAWSLTKPDFAQQILGQNCLSSFGLLAGLVEHSSNISQWHHRLRKHVIKL